jgi:hypothetical protein
VKHAFFNLSLDAVSMSQCLNKVVTDVELDSLWIPSVPVFIPRSIGFWMYTNKTDLAFSIGYNSSANVIGGSVVPALAMASTFIDRHSRIMTQLERPLWYIITGVYHTAVLETFKWDKQTVYSRSGL